MRMEQVYSSLVEQPGYDLIVFRVPIFKYTGSDLTTDTKFHRRFYKVLKYGNDTVKVKLDTTRYKGLEITLNFSRIAHTHNLYFFSKDLIQAIELLRSLLEENQIFTVTKDYYFYRFEYGVNVESTLKDDLTSWLYLAYSLDPKTINLSRNDNHVSYVESEEKQTFFRKKGYWRYEIYDKTKELVEEQGVLPNINIVRLEFTFFYKYLEFIFGTSRVVDIHEHISDLFAYKLKRGLEETKNNREICKSNILKEIIRFKAAKKVGIYKHIMKTFHLVSTNDFLEVVKNNRKYFSRNHKLIEEKLSKSAKNDRILRVLLFVEKAISTNKKNAFNFSEPIGVKGVDKDL